MHEATQEDTPRRLTDEEQFCLEGCRTYKQYYGMRQGFEDGACAFCHPDPELNRIVWKDEEYRNFLGPIK